MPKLPQSNQYSPTPRSVRPTHHVERIASAMEHALEKEQNAPVLAPVIPIKEKKSASIQRVLDSKNTIHDRIEVFLTGGDLEEREALAGLLYWITKGSGFAVSLNSDLRLLPVTSTTQRYDDINRDFVGIKITVRRP
jgi:hypothetical protein